VLLLLISLTALASAGYLVSDSDYRVSQNHRSSVHSFLAANGGLYEYVGDEKVPDPTLVFAYSNGQATVTPQRLLDLGDGRVLYRITSQSAYQAPEGGVSTRNVSTTALYSISAFDVTAATVSLTTLHKTGGAGTLTGQDQASDGECDGAKASTIAGVAVPNGGYDQNGGSPVPDGDPDILENNVPDFISDLSLDWAGILNGDLVTPDYSIPSDPWPSIASDEWPVVQVAGDISLNPSSSGQGTLIVEGSLTMNGSWRWDGIVLVGDSFTSNGKNTIDGTIMAGLNVMLGQTPPDSDLGNGTKSYSYHSCNVLWAMQSAFGALHEVPGTWTESM
jgi:hypothetical protein